MNTRSKAGGNYNLQVFSDSDCHLGLDIEFLTDICTTINSSTRFGRLIHGSETVAKDVLEFVVFEKHLSNT